MKTKLAKICQNRVLKTKFDTLPKFIEMNKKIRARQ